MHPVAAYCALRGLGVYEYIAPAGEGPLFRIQRGRESFEWQLQFERGRWGKGIAGHRESYKPAPWESLPDTAYDQLPLKLVDEMCSL